MLPFAVTWVDLENIVLSQRKTNIWYHLYVESKNNANDFIFKTKTQT